MRSRNKVSELSRPRPFPFLVTWQDPCQPYSGCKSGARSSSPPHRQSTASLPRQDDLTQDINLRRLHFPIGLSFLPQSIFVLHNRPLHYCSSSGRTTFSRFHAHSTALSAVILKTWLRFPALSLFVAASLLPQHAYYHRVETLGSSNHVATPRRSYH